MCSDPARTHPLHIQHTHSHTHRASTETSVLIPSPRLCLSAHLPVFSSLSPPPSTLPSHFHTLLPEKLTCIFLFFLKILYTLHLGRLARVINVFPRRGSLPVRAVSGGSSLSPGMELTASVPSDLSHPSSLPLPSPADWGCCCMWVGGVELPALGSVTKRFSAACACYCLVSWQ